jgi:hypothetical protein
MRSQSRRRCGDCHAWTRRLCSSSRSEGEREEEGREASNGARKQDVLELTMCPRSSSEQLRLMYRATSILILRLSHQLLLSLSSRSFTKPLIRTFIVSGAHATP